MRRERFTHAKPYRRPVLSLAFVLFVAAIAGCASPSDTPRVFPPLPDGDPSTAWTDAFMFNHRHAEGAVHDLSSDTMLELANLPLEPWRETRFGEADLLGEDHLVVASVAAGFFVIDIKNRAEPTVASFNPDPGYVADVKSSRNGDFVFAASQGVPGGVHAFYVGNPAAPVLAGYIPDVNGCHMISVYEDRIFCAGSGSVVTYRYVESGPLVTFQQLAVFQPGLLPIGSDPVLTGTQATHDMTVQLDPLTGGAVMYVSFWDAGLVIVDVTDSANFVELGTWNGQGADEIYGGQVHTAMASIIDGRRIVAVVPEFVAVPAVYFLDATDFSDITFVSAWVPLSQEAWAEDDPALFSTHNFQFVGGRIYLAMNHGGVWVLDASTVAAIRVPAPLGFLLPVIERGDLVPMGSAPLTWDVLVKDGYIYASDSTGGLFVLHFADDELGDPARTSFA